MALVEFLLFALSSGLFFNERFRRNKVAVGIAGTIALISSIFLYYQLRQYAPIVVAWIENPLSPSLPQIATQPSNVSSAGSELTPDQKEIAGVIKPLYVDLVDPQGEHQTPWWVIVPWTVSMKRLVLKMKEYDARHYGLVVDFNPIDNAQDVGISDLSVTVDVFPSDDRADAVAQFVIARERTFVTYSMLRENGLWRVDDIKGRSGPAQYWSVRQFIANAGIR